MAEKFIGLMNSLDLNLLLYAIVIFGIALLVWLAYKYQITWLQNLIQKLAEDAVKMAEQMWKTNNSTDRYAVALNAVNSILNNLKYIFIKDSVVTTMVNTSLLAAVNELPPSHERYGIDKA